MAQITLEQIHKDMIGMKKEMEHLKTLIKEDYELADDVVTEIEESRKRPINEFVSHDDMKKEFA